MIQTLTTFESMTTDPYQNLAVEEYLTFHTEPGECILYLWQNAHTVVIGRNQNCWKECRVSELEADGGHLVRRLSGGGAVYHDLGNLNFTFCMCKEDADVDRQLQVIIEAVASFGLTAEKTGRNDVAINRQKFSGNAFFDSKGCYYHHGTLLLNVDTTSMSRFLNPSKAKLQSKGVDSVRSRVVNLSSLCPEITVDTMKQAMFTAFSKVYGLPAVPLCAERLEQTAIQDSRERFSSERWKYGPKIPFTNRLEQRFSWGEVNLDLHVNEGMITKALLSSDSMEADWFSDIGTEFQGLPYRTDILCKALDHSLEQHLVPENIRADLCRMVQEQI
ncbi:MAG: lipoate--protein ligase [Blautia sp.]|nr:lipoate--protein ligase [Blautia sp.]MDY2898776.1 lipoate--protein ligase [Candidatus Limivivens sp.]